MKAFIFILCFLSSQIAFTQNNEKRNQAVRSLNLYIHYCNETIHGMWSLFRNLENFNSDLLYKYGKKIEPNDYFPTFRNDSVFNIKFNYKDYKIPQIVYQECIAKSSILDPQDQKNLNTRLTHLKGIVDKFVQNGTYLQNYCKNKTFLTDNLFTEAFKKLDEYETLFQQYDNAKDSLFAEIQAIYKKKYPPTNQQKPIVAIATQMEEPITIYKSIMDDLSKCDTSQFIVRKEKVKPLIDSLEAQMERKIKNLHRFGRSNGLDVGWRYEMVIDGLKNMYKNQETFLKTNWEKKVKQVNRYERINKCLYFYNTSFTNRYNRFGMGVISRYNEFVDLADGKQIQKEAEIPDYYIKNKSINMDVSVNVLLYWVEEPHLYKVVRPEKENTTQNNNNTSVTNTNTQESTTIDFNNVEVGKAINLKNIIFRISEDVLLPSSYTELNSLLKFMQDNPKAKILLEGHTDYFGNPEGNMKLSKKRVNVVKNYLVNKGISGKRIELKWYGGTRPLIKGETEEERKTNRRVECIILEK
ncbi:MAG: OmpA family protein [Raineya sp.]|jgi:outer membrane protein OmpA-like peptidoglycan-associated protein|nr:OmpA family protein [Raineya sp.]